VRELKKIVTIITLIWCVIAYGHDHLIIIDAGSTGSRLHLYAYTVQPGQLPKLDEVVQYSVKPGIDHYKLQPRQVQAGINQLLSKASQYLQLKGCHTAIPVHLLATGGMRRLTPVAQAAIYRQLAELIKKNKCFNLKTLQTISGQQEAVYGWLAVNDVYQRLQPSNPKTIGLLDLGGASVEITFATPKKSRDSIPVCLANRCYWLYARSVMDTGLEHVLAQLGTGKAASVCYPQAYPLGSGIVGGYDLQACKTLVRDRLQHKLASIVTMLPTAQTFVATSGFYYTFTFFHAVANLTSLHAKTVEACEQTPWPKLVQQHPHDAPEQMRKYCFASALIEVLLSTPSGFAMPSNTTIIISKYHHHQDIAWARGAALYALAGSKPW
jgi:GDA1/CD39 (nucleoside phosphatase) family